MRSRQQLRAIFAALARQHGSTPRSRISPDFEDTGAAALESKAIGRQGLTVAQYKKLSESAEHIPLSRQPLTPTTIPVYSIDHGVPGLEPILRHVGKSDGALPTHLIDALTRIPPHMWETPHIRGIIFDKMSHIRGLYFAQTGNLESVNMIAAFYNSDTGLIHLPALRSEKANSLKAKAKQAIVLLHEFGHAVDHGPVRFTGDDGRRWSESDQWEDAATLAQDMAKSLGMENMGRKLRLRKTHRTNIGYAFSSYHEAFAEFFSWYIRGGNPAKTLKKLFPTVHGFFHKLDTHLAETQV